jgi:hypothetical protein
MRLGIIAICVLFLTALILMEDYENRPARKELVRLEIEKTKLEIEKLNFELKFYREQEAIAVSVD